MNYIIRELLASDLKDNSFFETLSNLRKAENIAPELANKIFKDCEAKGIVTLVAEENGKIIGTIRLLFEQKYYHDGRFAGHIEDVVTHQDHEGKGVAKALINRAIDLCQERNCYKIILNCSDEFTGFYKKFGFNPSGNCLRFDI